MAVSKHYSPHPYFPLTNKMPFGEAKNDQRSAGVQSSDSSHSFLLFRDLLYLITVWNPQTPALLQ